MLADHVAQFVQRRHHVVVAVLTARGARPRHLQVFQHGLQFLEQPARGILVAGARQIFQPVEHALEILLAQRARVTIERPRKLLRILAHLLGKSLQELVHGRAQLIHQLLDFFVARAAFERLTKRLLCLTQCLFGLRDVSVFKLNGHVPQPGHHFAQGVVVFRILKIEIDRTQAEIDAGFLCEALRRDSERVKRGKHQRFCFGVERQDTPLLDERASQGLYENPLRQRQLLRLTTALIAGLIPRRQRHDRFGTGPRMLGKVMRGLRRTGAGARLRQGECVVRRGEQRTTGCVGRRPRP